MSAAYRAFLLLPAAATLACGWQAPQTAPDVPPALRITVTLVQVDVVVTDSSGRLAAGLGKENFQILQDGQPRKITWFSYVPSPPPAAEDQAAGPVAPASLAPVPMVPGQVQRTVALVVDDMALSFEDLVRTREALRKYIEKVMQPGDLVALVRTGGGVAILEQFTSDKRILLEAVDLLKWKYYGRVGVGVINTPEGAEGREKNRGAAPEALEYGYSLDALGALRTLEETIQGMKRFPGRKSIVFLSDSLQATPELSDALDHLTDLANRSAVSIYTVDPGGLRIESRLRAADSRVYPGDRTRRHFPSLGASGANEDDPAPAPGWPDGLSYLAARTGGLFYRDTNDIPGAIRAATADQLGYYLLGYSPGEGTFDQNPRSARFHKVTVRVNQPGLKVRWKSGFEGVPDDALPADTAAAGKTRQQQLAEALLSPFTATGLKVRLSSFFVDTKPAGPAVHSMLHFDARDLTFVRAPDGGWSAMVDVIALAYRGLHQPIRQTQRVQPIRLTDAAYRRAMKEGFLLHVITPAPEPGTFLIRAVVRDWDSGRIGSASQVTRVPDVRKGRFAMSTIVVRLASNELLQELGNREIGTSQNGKVEEWSEGGPALRRFRPGQIVAYGYAILNPRLAGTPRQPRLTTRIHLYRNGKLIFTGVEAHEVLGEEDDPTRYVSGGVLRLGDGMAPGEYILQATVTDGLAPKKKAVVSDWMDFEVVDAPKQGAAEAAEPGATHAAAR